ncbi:MAG: tetratricopeptide repeat protein [Planctomycetes bacterium]|nr:tetratricopeptide repeat protein [Planctomycetota bacterium]
MDELRQVSPVFRLSAVLVAASVLVSVTGCAFIYYRESIVLTLPTEIRAPEPGAYETAMAGGEPEIVGFLYELNVLDAGQERADAFLKNVRDARITLFMLTGGKAPYHEVLANITSAVHRPRVDTGRGMPALMDMQAVFEGRNRECLPLTLAYLVIGRSSGLLLYPVITRGHILVLYDDGVNAMYVDVARNLMDADGRELSIACFGGSTPPEPYLRPLSDGELAAVILANRAVSLQDAEEGLKNATAATILFPGLPTAWVNRGVLLEKSGRVTEAAQSYARATGIDPKNDYAVYGLAHLMLDPANKDIYDPAASRAILARAAENRTDVPDFIKVLLETANRLCGQTVAADGPP